MLVNPSKLNLNSLWFIHPKGWVLQMLIHFSKSGSSPPLSPLSGTAEMFVCFRCSVIGWGLRDLANKLRRWIGESHLAWQISHNSPGAAGSGEATEGSLRGRVARSFSLSLSLPSFLWSNVGVVWCQSDLALTWEGLAVQHLNELEQMVSGVG